MNATLVYTGTNVLQSNTEVLTAMPLHELAERIKSDPQLRDEVIRIRKIASMDQMAYQRVKTRLPYFCCGKFGNGIRKSEHFESISCFVVDLDKIPSERTEEIRQTFIADPRVMMLFTSPGAKGLKIVFELDHPCTSLKQYSDFYKAFAYHLQESYRLADCLDKSTSDATRVSFLSHDPELYYNPLNEPVVMDVFLPDELFAVVKETTQAPAEKEKKQDAIPEETYREILRKLNPDARPAPKKKQIFIPEALRIIENPVREEFSRLGLLVKEVRDINYGKKFIFTMGFGMGEVNLFYGSRGFSVVQSPKSGADPKLNELGEMIIRKVLAEGRPADQVMEQVSDCQLN